MRAIVNVKVEMSALYPVVVPPLYRRDPGKRTGEQQQTETAGFLSVTLQSLAWGGSIVSEMFCYVGR